MMRPLILLSLALSTPAAAHLPLPSPVRRIQAVYICERDAGMCKAVRRALQDGDVSDAEYRSLVRRHIARWAAREKARGR